MMMSLDTSTKDSSSAAQSETGLEMTQFKLNSICFAMKSSPLIILRQV